MLIYRKYTIWLINTIVFVWASKEIFFSKGPDDFFGIFFLVGMVFMICYNIYAILVFVLFKKIKSDLIYIEVLYYILLVIPFLLFLYSNAFEGIILKLIF